MLYDESCPAYCGDNGTFVAIEYCNDTSFPGHRYGCGYGYYMYCCTDYFEVLGTSSYPVITGPDDCNPSDDSGNSAARDHLSLFTGIFIR